MTGDIDNDFGMKCPNPDCRASDQIDVAATVWVRLCHNGTDVTEAGNGDHEWTDETVAKCCGCGHTATVKDFDADNQPHKNDNELRAKRAAEALYGYVKAKSEVYEESSSEIVDLITDLLHLIVKLNEGDDPVESTLRLAQMHFEAEQNNEGDQ
jgi:hypothetical protein